MASALFHNGFRTFRLKTADGRMQADIVPDLGGIAASLVLPGPDGHPREALFRHSWFWDPGTQETRGGIPLLFPICGRLLQEDTPGLYRVHGQAYALPIHGFAMRQPWEVVAADSPECLQLRLTDTAETRAMYPFCFELTLIHAISEHGYSCRFTVVNTGNQPMPYSAGFHPYFSTPPPGKGKETMEFSAPPATRWRYNATKTDVTVPVPAPVFPMPVVHEDVNALLLELGEPHETRLIFPDGHVIRQSASPLLRFRQFYTLAEEPFFCDEAWMAPPGSLNRPGAARELPPGQSESVAIHISSGPAGSQR